MILPGQTVLYSYIYKFQSFLAFKHFTNSRTVVVKKGQNLYLFYQLRNIYKACARAYIVHDNIEMCTIGAISPKKVQSVKSVIRVSVTALVDKQDNKL